MIEKGFNQAGRGPASPLLRRALRVRRYLDMHGKHSLYWICMESKKYSLLICHSSPIIWFKFRNVVIRRPRMGQDSPHLATPVTGAHRSRSFSHPVASHSFLVCSPSPCGERPFSLLPVSPLFVARLRFFLRLLLRASLGDVAWRRVTPVEPASR